METQSIIAMVLIGAIAGWLAGMIMKGSGMGFIVNALVGNHYQAQNIGFLNHCKDTFTSKSLDFR